MANDQRRLILANGEEYLEEVTKPVAGRPGPLPRTYESARELVQRGVASSLDLFEDLPSGKKHANEAVLCLRLHPDATAKSYSPEAIFNAVPGLRSVGSRNYRAPYEQIARTERLEALREKGKLEDGNVEGRLLFVQGEPRGFRRLLNRLDSSERSLPKGFVQDIRRIERIDVLSPSEQILGFDRRWTEGRAELVFHPTRATRQQEFLFELFEYSQIDARRSSINVYPNGPTFVSCHLNRASLELIAGTNPLRSAHPLEFDGLPAIRTAPQAPCPAPPADQTRSTILVGHFDGGVDPDAPLLRGHVEYDESLSIRTPPHPAFVSHGTAVAGALLHGPLNAYSAADTLPPPPVSVVSIRCLPTSNPIDVDLYESIDVIERAVPARKDVSIYCVPFGPRGPVEDDSLTRFTYVLDQLAAAHKVTFFVAAGNDGEVDGFNRIQPPSDLANGCGVGAHDFDRQRALYSCKGPGREGAKIKPDITAFGGCPNRPFHLVSPRPGFKALEWGTSFAAPLAARLAAQAAKGFDRSSSLLARALVVHTAGGGAKEPDQDLGHGCIAERIEDVVSCDPHSVTIVYQGDILPTRIVKIPIPWPDAARCKKVEILWTVAALSPVSVLNPGDYTSVCLEDTFYPNSRVFSFEQEGTKRKRRVHTVRDAALATSLSEGGWRRGSFPISDSGNVYRDEMKRRAIDCKWETVVRRRVSKELSSLDNPFLTLHAIGRHGASDRFDWAVAVTLRPRDYVGDLYTDVRTKFPALAPIRLRTDAEIRVRIS